MIRVKLVEEDKRRRFEDITRALSVAYNENRAVLVTNNDEFVCAYIPDHQDYTIQINDEGIEPIYGEFVNFKNERYFDWYLKSDTGSIKVIHSDFILNENLSFNC